MDIEQIMRNRVVYEIPGMDQAYVSRDHIYKKVGAQELMCDIYSPPDAGNQPLPAVIFVHGDGLAERLEGARGWGQYISWGELIAASGMRAVIAHHRSSMGHTRMQDPASDVDDLVAHVRSQSTVYGIDSQRLAIWMCSAGGPFGMRTAIRNTPPYIKAIVAYYALLDLLHLRETIPPLLDEKTIQEFSPTYTLDDAVGSIAPLFMVKVAHDSPHFNQSIDRFVAKVEAKRADIQTVIHPEGQHGFDIFNDDETSRSIIQQTLTFLQAHLLG